MISFVMSSLSDVSNNCKHDRYSNDSINTNRTLNQTAKQRYNKITLNIEKK